MYHQDAEENKEALLDMCSFKVDNPFSVHFENYDAERYDRKPRAKPNQQ